jgi:hypothetical protein
MENITQPPAHEITLAGAEARAVELAAKYGVKVYPILFYREADMITQADPIVGYLKEPPRLTKLRIIDEGSKRGEMEVAAELLDIALLKEESDYRISSADQQYDEIYMGACLAASVQIIRVAINQIKKK